MPDRISQETLAALSRATLAVAQADDLDTILQQIADSARILLKAEYAAIGVSASDDLLAKLVFSGVAEETIARMPHLPHGRGLLGAVLREKRPIRLSHLTDDPRSVDLLPGHPPMTSFLGFPILADEIVMGLLYVTNRIGADSFSELDEQLAEILAAHAAIALRRSRLLGSNQENRQQLEKRNRQLAALNWAAMAIAGELALDKVLQQIVDSVRMLAHAQYAALGVPNADGFLDVFVFSGMSKEEAAKLPHLPKGLGLLGAIIHEKRPIRIPHISSDPRSVGFPEGHPPMDSFLGVPIIAAGQTLGNLYLTNKLDGPEFTADDQMLVEMLAAHAAVAIQNARLYEQVGRLAIVEERTRIGMDLHDGVIQSIYAVGLTLESTRLALPAGAEEADQLLAQAIEGLNNTIRDIRNFILDLRPHRFRGDLDEGLARLVREFQANTMVSVTLSAPNEAVSGLPTPTARAMFLTTQEALANVARHAHATHVVVNVTRENQTVKLSIADNGRGFDPMAQARAVGHGLSNMRARAEELGGAFSLESVPGKGTKLTLVLPFAQ